MILFHNQLNCVDIIKHKSSDPVSVVSEIKMSASWEGFLCFLLPDKELKVMKHHVSAVFI